MTAEYPDASPIPSETVEQQQLFQWARMASGKWPELELMYKIPNEGKRTRAGGSRMKAEGLKKGVPDICLPVPRGKYHGLYIEMKRVGETLRDEQKEWMQALAKNGYCCYTGDKGWEDVSKMIVWYLNLKGETDEI